MAVFLEQDRATLEQHLPGLDKALAEVALMTLERPGSPGLSLFRDCGGPALLVPRIHAGIGATAQDAVRIQRAVGARSPSLAVATTMHHFSVAGLVEAGRASAGFEWMLLEAIAQQGLLVASGFAEGRTGQGVLSPTMRAQERDGALFVSGSKKPCSLARSMDLLTASVAVPGGDGDHPELAVAVIPATSPGITVKPFWNSFALAGAESDELVLEDVEVPEQLIIRTGTMGSDPLSDLQASGFVWFEVLVSASYLGSASALVERVLGGGRADPSCRAALIVEVEAAMAGLLGVAHSLDAGDTGEDVLARSLVCRYATQDVIGRVVTRAVELVGGMSFIRADDVAYLAAASAALSFHPPSRGMTAAALSDHFAGRPLVIS